MKHKSVILVIAGLAILCLLAVSPVVAAEPQSEVKKEVKVVTKGGMGPCGQCRKGMPMEAGMPGTMMPDLPPDVERKMVEQQMKFVKETAPIKSDLAVRRLEMRLLWLDDNPNADKLIAKLGEINQLMLQLQSKAITRRLATYSLLPPAMKKDFLKGGCGGMGMMGMGSEMCPGGEGMRMEMGMGKGMGMCSGLCGAGMGMGAGGQKRVIMKIMDTERNTKMSDDDSEDEE
jgi:Spy/CpxP family protein refolding chaperone